MANQSPLVRAIVPEKRDFIFIGLGIILLVLFLGKTLEVNPLGNLQLLTMIMATTGIVAAGQTLVVITGGVDFSVGSVIGLTGVIIALLSNTDLLGPFSPWVALVIGLFIAAAIGWGHGTLVSDYRLAPFIVTFGSATLLRGVTQAISNGSVLNLHTKAFDWLWATIWGTFPVPALVMLVVFLLTAYVLRNTRFGRYTYAIGSNETVARLSGVNVNRTRKMVYAVSGLLAGLEGFLLLTWLAASPLGVGDEKAMASIAAVIIGGTSLGGGTGSVWGTLGGVLLLALVRSSLVLFSVPTMWNDIITGGVIVGAALIDMQRRRKQEAAPTPAPLQSLVSVAGPPINTLDQAINRFTLTLQERYNCDSVRVYLLDRESGNFVEPVSHALAESTSITQVGKTGKPLYVGDIRRDSRLEFTSPSPDIRAVAAVPIAHDHRLVGVAELHSKEIDPFKGPTLDSVIGFGTQMARTLEDNWLLEGGWLAHQVRDNLRNLFDDMYLDRSGLCDWLFLNSGDIDRGAALRRILIDAIEHLCPQNVDPQSRTMRRHQILKQTYVDQKHIDILIQELGLSRRQYFYDLKEAIEAVTHWLVTQRRVQ